MKRIISVVLAVLLLFGSRGVSAGEAADPLQDPVFRDEETLDEESPDEDVPDEESMDEDVPDEASEDEESPDEGPQEEPPAPVPYSRVYEPETAWSMSATVVWEADASVVSAAGKTRRPATAIVYPTASLRVEDRDGNLIAESLDEYVVQTAGTIIPAFWIRDRETASALKAWLEQYGLLDCFVVSSPALKDAVGDVADLLHARGVIDFSRLSPEERFTPAEMAACVNEAHGKTVILSREAATRENIVRLQSLAATVWVRCVSDTRSLLTMYTRGVHGVVVENPDKAIQMLGFFKDDAPVLLRVPLTIGHRGDPSAYMENTLDSAAGAVREGADSVENDIQLSADGKLFILHDEEMMRLFNREDVTAEDLTLAELRNIFADWEDPFRGIPASNEVAAEDSRYGTFYGQEEKKQYTVPTLEEYIQAFRDTGIVHDTEIKSMNPAILPVYKAMVDGYDAWDQFFSITFNPPILDAVYADYPGLSIGALGFMSQYGENIMILFGGQSAFLPAEDPQPVLSALFAQLDTWNATANPDHTSLPKDVAAAARHRGLTFWPWTYTDKSAFAEDYLFGMSGLTTDYPWWTENLLEEIESEDLSLKEGEPLPKPMGRNKRNERMPLETAEAVRVEDLPDGSALMIWRYKADLLLGDESFGSYYMYSEPFTLKTETPPPVPGTGDASAPALWMLCVLAGVSGLSAPAALKLLRKKV